jgi:hypothetical protein
MRAIAFAAAVLAASTTAAVGPVEPSHTADGQWVCGLAVDWKAVMRRDYPNADRSIPEVERRCHMARE